jgi:predicted ribosomally synthesized peptide with SipW-like signal peptide
MNGFRNLRRKYLKFVLIYRWYVISYFFQHPGLKVERKFHFFQCSKGLIAIIVVIALGVIGVGYAAWTSSLTVNGTVNPGTFNVKIVGSAVAPGTGTPATYSTVTYGTNAGVNDGNNAPLAITINYAVPGTYAIPLKITNLSTIPVAISYAGIDKGTLPTGSTVTGGPVAATLVAGADDGGTTLTVTLPDTMPKTGGSYTFTVPISVTQGN